MTEPTFPHDPQPRISGAPPSAPRFRLVTDTPEGDGASDTGPENDRWSSLSRKLLVPADEWNGGLAEAPAGMILARADIPLLAAIARIRSDADAALALTSVLETLSAEVGVALPCAALGGTEFGLVIPKDIAMESVAETIDEALQGQVRSTDLQGPLRDRSGARVELL